MSRRAALALLPATLSLLLAGCATGSPSASPSATDEPVDTPAPTVTVTPPAAELGPETPYDEFHAWLSCRDLTTYFYPDPSRLEFASFDESEAVRRDDGLIYVYIETVDSASDEVKELASECILGGTLGEPNQAQFGVAVRSDDRDPNVPLPSA